jgi:predicted MPP superfamily phosphohydrolase
MASAMLRMEGGPPGVVWVVQVSDIHISKWKPERGRSLRRALGHALKLIKPAIVLISGDLIGMLFLLWQFAFNLRSLRLYAL